MLFPYLQSTHGMRMWRHVRDGSLPPECFRGSLGWSSKSTVLLKQPSDTV